MDAALSAMLTQTLPWRPYASQNAYGVPVYGAGMSVPARVEHTTRTVLNRAGQAVVSTTTVFVGPTVALSHRDQLILPDGSTPAIQELREILDVDGSRHHWEVLM